MLEPDFHGGEHPGSALAIEKCAAMPAGCVAPDFLNDFDQSSPVAPKLHPLATDQLSACLPEFDRTTVMMHLRVLEQAGLVVPVRKGRERFNHLDAMPIAAIHERWIGPHAERAAAGLLGLKRSLESEDELVSIDKP